MMRNDADSRRLIVDTMMRFQQDLFVHIRGILDSMKLGKGQEECKNTLDFAEKIIREEFEAEEQTMESLRYAGTVRHREAHGSFRRDYQELKSQFETGGTSTVLAIRLQRLLCQWQKKHVSLEDAELIAFLKA